MTDHARDRVLRFLRRATDESIRSDVIGALFILGALLGAISMLLPHPDQGETAIWGVVAVAAVTGATLIAWPNRWSTPVIHAAVAFGTLLINVMMLASGVASGVYAAMFCWAVLVSVNFFSLRAAALQFAWMMGTFALVLAVVDTSSGYSAVTRWLTVTLALAVTGGATAWLVYRRRLAEETSQKFLDLSREMLCTIDANGRITRLNQAWEQTLGHPTSALHAMPVAELVHPEDRPATERALAQLTEGVAKMTLENRVRREDGSFHRLVWSASFSEDESLIYARVRQVSESEELDRAA